MTPRGRVNEHALSKQAREHARIGEPSRRGTSCFPLMFAALTGRSGHGFALRFPLWLASLAGRSGPGLSLLADKYGDAL